MAVLMYFMPESPFYLISQGKVKEAEKSLQFLRRSEEVDQFIHIYHFLLLSLASSNFIKLLQNLKLNG
jgi:hypothetical protein